MSNTQLIQTAQKNVRSLLEQCNVPYKIIPFDEVLYQECIDEAKRRGYPVDGEPSVLTYLREGVRYAATAGGHIPHRPTQIWIGLFTSCFFFIDDVPERFQADLPNLYLFNERFIRKEPQGSGVLDAFADLIRRGSDFYQPVASHLMTTSTLNFVAAGLLEYETKTMKILSSAREYPAYQRILSGNATAYDFMVFPREIPLNDYIQAIPEMTLFLNNVNDVLSFYKEERAGDMTNQVSTLAARTNKSKLEAFGDVTEGANDLYKRIVDILEVSPEACGAFKDFTAGYIHFHTSTPRYRFEDLDL